MVLLVNDSIYGPLAPLEPILARIDLEAADLWGATESWQTRYHLQSFFLAAGRTVLTSPA
jgi:lipopolysaccharide biosynthesis protein